MTFIVQMITKHSKIPHERGGLATGTTNFIVLPPSFWWHHRRHGRTVVAKAAIGLEFVTLRNSCLESFYAAILFARDQSIHDRRALVVMRQHSQHVQHTSLLCFFTSIFFLDRL